MQPYDFTTILVYGKELMIYDLRFLNLRGPYGRVIQVLIKESLQVFLS